MSGDASAENLSAGAPTQAEPRLSLSERLRRNPIVLKELRSRMRGNRAFAILTIYLVLLGLLVSLVYFLFSASGQGVGASSNRQVFGKVLFGIVVWMQLLIVSFVAPALTSGAISSEREHRTYDLLRATLLPARSLVLGKFFSALVFILLLLFTALPLQSLAFLFGGVATEEFLIGTALLIVTAIAFCAAGVFFSSLMKRTLVSTVLSYAFAILMVFGLPMLFFLTILLFDATIGQFGSQLSANAEVVLLVVGWFLAATNPLATGIITEALLLDQQSVFFFNFPLSNGRTVILVSPWIPFILLYLLASILFLWRSIRNVNRVEK